MRERIRSLACRWLNLVRIERATEVCVEAVAEQKEESARRIDALRDGLTGFILGPIGDMQVQSYERAAAVVRSEHFKTPLECQMDGLRRMTNGKVG